MKIWKKMLRSIWGVAEVPTEMAAPIACDACRIARMNGGDACWEHHHQHPRAHTYRIGHELGWGSGIDGRDDGRAQRGSSSSIS